MKRWVGLLVFLVIGMVLPSTAHAQAKPSKVRVIPQIAANRLMKRVPPKYPARAKAQHIEGAVVLKVNIDKEGDVSDAKLISGPSELVPASIEAVKQWKYDPYILNGFPVAMETQVTVNFTLEE